MKTIIFIPPNGNLKKHDFSLNRIVKEFSKYSRINCILLYISKEKETYNDSNYDNIIKVKSTKELFKNLNTLKYDIIFSRSWMHAYSFSAELVKKFDNVIVNIKDWNFSKKKEYRFLFGNDDDFDAIKYIFKNAKKVLSHYTSDQAKIWAKKYNVSKDKFIFFPEYCNSFDTEIPSSRKKNRIVFAGAFSKSSYPIKFFVSKDMYRTIKVITKQSLNLDYIFPPKFYDSLNHLDYQDFLFENEFNKYFNIKKGEELNHKIINNYGYSIFSPFINKYRNKKLFKYAVPSKFAFYLEANLPIIVNKEMKSLSKLVTKYGLGIVVSNKDIKNLKNIIKNKDYDKIVRNIIQYKKKFSYKNIKLEKLLCN